MEELQEVFTAPFDFVERTPEVEPFSYEDLRYIFHAVQEELSDGL